MPRLFRRNQSAQDYMLLDDELLDNGDNELTDQSTPGSLVLSEHYVTGTDSDASNTNSMLSRLRIPRINFAYFARPRTRRIIDVSLSLTCIFAVLSVSCSLGYITLAYHMPVIDKSYRAFGIPTHEAWLNYAAFQAAKKNHTSFYHSLRHVNMDWMYHTDRKPVTKHPNNVPYNQHSASGRHRRDVKQDAVINTPVQYNRKWKMQVVFMAKEGENIFTRERLQQIHDIEKRIMAHEQFPDFCFKDIFNPSITTDPAVKAINGCAPLNSLMTYFFPSSDHQGNIYYDGLGDNMDNIQSALKLAMTSTKFYYYVDDKVNSSNLQSQLIRTEVIFGSPLKGHQNKDEQGRKFKEFVVSYIDILSQSSSTDVQVLYGGNEIFDYEVETTFWSDVKLAVYALVSIFLLMLLLTGGSLWLTFWGYVSIMLSAPLAIFFYRVLFKVEGLGILNGAAAFVIIGIGVDDVFVFINVFRQAAHMKSTRGRTLYTMKTAGKATFFTSFTTAAAFAANISSMIPAVHDFGLFMALIVANCWITVMLLLPPVLYIWDLGIRQCEDAIYTRLCSCLPSCKSSRTLPEDIARCMDKRAQSHSGLSTGLMTGGETIDDDDDDDVPLLNMDNPTLYIDVNEDEALVDPDPLVMPGDQPLKPACHLGAMLQAAIYHILALPIIKMRKVILGITFVLLCVSIGLVTQLRTSTKPPQFFREDTNIQKLLNLKSKYSTMGPVTCNDCSAIYSLGKKRNTQPSLPPHTPPAWQPTPVPTSRLNAPAPHQGTQAPHFITPAPHHITLAPHHITPPAPASTLEPHNRDSPGHETPRRTIPPAPLTKPPQTHRPFTAKPVTAAPISVPENYDVCAHTDCSHPKQRPQLESGTTVYVVFGVQNFHWSTSDMEHVMSDDMGVIEYNEAFSSVFNFTNPGVLDGLRELCTVCKIIANNTQLVRNGSADCIPSGAMPSMMRTMLLGSVEECRDLPRPHEIYGNIHKSAQSLGGITSDGTSVLWLAFAFESTTSKAQSYFAAHKEYQRWESFLEEVRDTLAPDSPLKTMFQTSEFWPEVFMEIVAVDSAVYSIVLSMVICMVAVMLFTRHVKLLFIIFISITEMVCLVVGIFYVLGWEIGGVEAISLSILVGSSVDYCVHLVEGYILAVHTHTAKQDAGEVRRWRTAATFSHIGVSIISSALTTIIAAIPLTQTTIQPFAKFGQIIAINTTVCITYSLTLCVALLATIAPAYFNPDWRSTIKAIIGTLVAIGAALLVMYILSVTGIEIPGPNGGTLF